MTMSTFRYTTARSFRMALNCSANSVDPMTPGSSAAQLQKTRVLQERQQNVSIEKEKKKKKN